MDSYTKNFDDWNKEKKLVNASKKEVFAHPREVWWCSLGINIGSELDGKNDNFERPVIIVRVYNKETMLVLPTTSKSKTDKFHLPIEIDVQNPDTKEKFKRMVYVKLTQARVISNKRLLRKVDVISESEFERIHQAFKSFV